jgi:hypothetical protein
MKQLFLVVFSFFLLVPASFAGSSDPAVVLQLATEARDVLVQLRQKAQMLGDQRQMAMLDADVVRIDQLLYDIQMISQNHLASRPAAPTQQPAPVVRIGVPGVQVQVVDPNVQWVDPNPQVVAQPAPVATCEPMPAGRFSAVIGAMGQESFSDGKHRVLQDAAYGAWFSVAQVKQAMAQFPFDDDKVEAAAALYPQVCDLDAWFTIYQALTFDSSRDALRARTGR